MDAVPFSEVELSRVRKVFGRRPVLRGVDATLRAGEVTALMGPNGAGKSTLLAILSTLSRPTSGEVSYGGIPHRQAERDLRRQVGLVGHSPMLYHDMSTRENLIFFAKLYDISPAEEQAERWLDRVGLTRAADRPVRHLSRGMAQRAALARALICRPQLLLLDEPLTGLDRQAGEVLFEELGRCRQRGVVLLLVTHEAADGLCDRLLVLHRGRIADDLAEPGMSAARMLERYHAAV